MKFLLTNDDGIDAPGLAALEEAFQELGDCVVVAPDRHLSGCSHQATTHRGLEVTSAGTMRWAVDGTPVDCTRVGLLHLAQNVDWVIAGINEGGNLGADVYLSGTVAAVREAALLGYRGLAFSQYRQRVESFDWANAMRWSREIARLILERYPESGGLWNVNLPHLERDAPLPEIVFCALDPHPLPVRFRSEEGRLRYCGTYQERAREDGFDVAVCFSGRIAVTHLLLG